MYWVHEPSVEQASWWYPLVLSARRNNGYYCAWYLFHWMSMKFLKGFYIVLHFWYALFWF